MDRLADRYVLRRLLGRGSIGEVCDAWDEHLHQRVTIKVLRADLADQRTLARLRREIATAHRVTHPNVCRVHDVEVSGAFCTMELLEGETLAARIHRGALSIAEAPAPTTPTR